MLLVPHLPTNLSHVPSPFLLFDIWLGAALRCRPFFFKTPLDPRGLLQVAFWARLKEHREGTHNQVVTSLKFPVGHSGQL